MLRRAIAVPEMKHVDIWTFVDALNLRLKDFQLSMCGTRLLFTKSANQNEFVFFPEN